MWLPALTWAFRNPFRLGAEASFTTAKAAKPGIGFSPSCPAPRRSTATATTDLRFAGFHSPHVPFVHLDQPSQRLEHVDEPAGPPLLADRAALAARLHTTLDRDRRRRLGPRRSWAPHSDTASGESAITLRSSATDISVSQPSPAPTIRSARAFFSSIIASIRSSRVPTQTNLRTCTSLRWPIRNARSVAWSSTAGFHHRSTWITWLAAVRFSPVPPALSDNRKIAGSAIAWNPATIASRCFFGVPPCR